MIDHAEQKSTRLSRDWLRPVPYFLSGFPKRSIQKAVIVIAAYSIVIVLALYMAV